MDAKTVKDFVALQKFLKPLLNRRFTNVEDLLQTLVKEGKRQQDVNIDQLFKSCAPCAGGLKRLHKGLANRGEMTEERAKGIVSHGKYLLMGPKEQVLNEQRARVTKAVNGGYNHLDERTHQTFRIYDWLK